MQGSVQLFLSLVIGQSDFQRFQNCHGALRVLVEIVADARFEIGELALGIRLDDADLRTEIEQRLGRHAAIAKSRDGRHTGIVPAVHILLLHQLFKITLGHHRVGDGKPRKLYLAGFGGKSEIDAHPVVKGTMILEFEGAKGMRDALHIVADRVRVIVHGIDAPRISRAVMGAAQNAVNDGIAEIHVRRRHIDLRAQTLFAVRVFARLHLPKKPEIFLYRAVSVRAFLSRFGQRATRSADLFGRKVAYERLAVHDQFFGVFVNNAEEIGRVHFFRPMIPYPFDVASDRLYKLRLFLGRIRVVEKQIALAAVSERGAEIDEHTLDVPDVEISVRLGRKTSLNLLDPACFEILVDNLFDKVSSFYFFHKIYPVIEIVFVKTFDGKRAGRRFSQRLL